MPFINGIGAPELIIILLVVLVIFGGSQIPKLARSLGEAKKEFENPRYEELLMGGFYVHHILRRLVEEFIVNADQAVAAPQSRGGRRRHSGAYRCGSFRAGGEVALCAAAAPGRRQQNDPCTLQIALDCRR